jgi:hypothetical protein
MDTIGQYQIYAADATQKAGQATCPADRDRFLLLAQGWLDLAKRLSTSVGSAVAPESPANASKKAP